MSANLPAGWKHASPADHLRPNDRHGLVPTFKTAAEARAFIEANASLPGGTLREALDHITRVAWQTGHSSRDVEVKAADELLLTIDTLRPRIAAFIARPDTHLSGSHADAVMLVEAVHRALGGGQ